MFFEHLRNSFKRFFKGSLKMLAVGHLGNVQEGSPGLSLEVSALDLLGSTFLSAGHSIHSSFEVSSLDLPGSIFLHFRLAVVACVTARQAMRCKNVIHDF